MKSAPVKLQPVRYPVYHELAELNRLAEEVFQLLGRLYSFSFLHRERLRACQIAVEEIRALANEDILEVLKGRELANAMYYQRRRLQWEKDLQRPKVVRNRKTDDPSLPRTARRRKARVSR